MREEGLSIAEIAARRSLRESTVYGHCADALARGRVEPEAVILLSLVAAALSRADETHGSG